MKVIHLVIFLYTASCYAQTNVQRMYGRTGNERGHAIVATTDGGFAIAGHTDSYGTGEDDFFILKTDAAGNIQWQTAYGGNRDDNGLSIAIKQTPDDGFAITGSSASFGASLSDLLLIRVNATGNILWDYIYDSGPSGNSRDHGRGLLICRNGDILVLGTDDSNLFGSNDGLILRVRDDGTLRWKNIYGGVANDHLHEAIELPGGNFLVCGSSQSFGPGNTAGYMLKLNPDGDVLWSRVYGGSSVEGFAACDRTSDWGIVATGISTSFSNAQSDILLCKIDSFGVLEWTKTFGGTDGERGASVKTLKDYSGFLVTAFTDSYGNGDRDIMVIRTNNTGEIVWSKTFGTQGYEGVDLWSNCTTTLTGSSGFAFTGWSDSLSHGREDVLLIKTDDTGSAFCGPVSVTHRTPSLTTLEPLSEIADVGIYQNITAEKSTMLMQSDTFCYCMSETLCSPCFDFTVEINASGDLTCDRDTVSLATEIGRPNLSYLWSNGMVHGENPVFNVVAPGLYTLHIQDTISGCVAVDSHVVFEDRFLPIADAGEDDILNCYTENVLLYGNENLHGQNLLFDWQGPPGYLIPDSLERTIIIDTPGQYIFTVIDTTNGCMSVDTVNIVDDRVFPIAEAGPAQILECIDTFVVLDASQSTTGSNFIHLWDGPGIENTESLFIEAYSGGTYYLQVINTMNGCASLDSTEVIATTFIFDAEILVNAPICAGDHNGQILIQTPIGGTPPYSYALNDSNYQSSALFGQLGAGSYEVMIIDSNACTWSTVVTIAEGTAVQVDLGADMFIQTGQQLTLSPVIIPSSIDSISWQPSSILSCTHCLNPSIIVQEPDTIHIYATVYSTGCLSVDTLLVFVSDKAIVFVPNVFSPNGDGVNDFITIFSNDPGALVMNMEIYDRWGEVVFVQKDFQVNMAEIGWNGAFRGKQLNSGVFVFVAQVLLSDQTVKNLSGNITLVK